MALFDYDLILGYVATFKRQVKIVVPTTKYCAICKWNFHSETNLLIHFKEHGKLFSVRGKEVNRIFYIIKKDKEKALTFKLENMFRYAVNITGIYLYTPDGLVTLTKGKVEEMKPKKTLAFSIERSQVTIPNHVYTLLVAADNGTFEFVEKYRITLKTGEKVIRPVLKFAKLTEVPVLDSIAQLCQFGQKDKFMLRFIVLRSISKLCQNGFHNKDSFDEKDKAMLRLIE